MRWAVCFLVLGCSSSPTARNPDLAASPDLALPAVDAGTFGQNLPQVVPTKPAGVLAHPNIVAITYDNDVNRADIEAFFNQYAQSTAWATQTAEYGVGPLTVGAPLHIAGNAPTQPTGDGVETLLKQNLGGAWGAADANTIYAFFIPVGSVFDDGSGSKCCTDYDGYHYDVIVGGVDVPYFIACQCPGFDGPGITDLQQLTTVAGHETLEAATDPLQEGFAETDDAHAVWTYASDGEVADLCEQNDTTFWQPSDMTYTVQRSWSNAAAAAGHDPCVGDPTAPYYQTVPEQPDAVSVDFGFGPFDTRGLQIDVGASRVVRLHVFADGPAGPFNITLQDYSSTLGYPARLEITNPTAPASPGDDLQATIKVLQHDPDLGLAEAFVVTTTPVAGNGPSTYYYGLVSQ